MENKWLIKIRDTYKLEKFTNFIGQISSLGVSVIVINYATTVRRYYYFACLQNNLFSECLQEALYNEKNAEYEYNVPMAPFANAFGIYTLIRTSLEACRKLCDACLKTYLNKELIEYRESHKKEIQNIINIANDMIKHPIVNNPPEEKTKISLPCSYGIGGDIGFDLWEWEEKDWKLSTKIVNPGKDIKIVKSYFEGMADILMKLKT